MSLLGSEGLKQVALASHAGLNRLRDQLAHIGVQPKFQGPAFHEQAFELPIPAEVMVNGLMSQKILPGLNLGFLGDAYRNTLLINVTETKTTDDLDLLVGSMQSIIARETASC